MIARTLLVISMFCAAAQALAQDRVDGAAGGRTVIKTYADPDGKSADGELTVAALKFPLRVLERSATNYLRIKVEYQDPAAGPPRTTWIDSAQVKLNASHQASCLHRDKSATAMSTAATRSANSNCK